MPLVKITERDNLVIDLIYGTDRNFVGKAIYANPQCYLHPDAAACLYRALAFLKPLGLGLKIYDAFRPMEAQNILWNLIQDPHYVANPHVGSNHSRGVAIDANIIDHNGEELDMGTHVDDFRELSHHRNQDISALAQRNRFFFVGVMVAAGWEMYDYEWWHYQLPDVKSYALLNDTVLEYGLMDPPHILG